jgi:hypothetical protein
MTRYRAAADALAATLADGAVLLNLRTKRYYSLNETGTRVWQLLIAGRAEEEIVAAMMSEYDVPAATAKAEIGAVIEALCEHELLVSDAG